VQIHSIEAEFMPVSKENQTKSMTYRLWQLKFGGLPADWDSPVPVSFLSVRDNIQFCGCIYSTLQARSPAEKTDLKSWLEITQTLLASALKEWGVGGKTSAGYGQMELQGI
jgi:CRISPR-associated protein Cmr6